MRNNRQKNLSEDRRLDLDSEGEVSPRQIELERRGREIRESLEELAGLEGSDEEENSDEEGYPLEILSDNELVYNDLESPPNTSPVQNKTSLSIPPTPTTPSHTNKPEPKKIKKLMSQHQFLGLIDYLKPYFEPENSDGKLDVLYSTIISYCLEVLSTDATLFLEPDVDHPIQHLTPSLGDNKGKGKKCEKMTPSLGMKSNLIINKRLSGTDLKNRMVDGGFELFTYLISYKTPGINIQDEYGESLLYKAASLGLVQNCELLMMAGVDMNIKNNDGKTAFYIASSLGYQRVVNLLLSSDKCDPQLCDGFKTSPLAIAAFSNHPNIVSLLLCHPSINVDIQDQYGWTPLMIASFLGHQEVASLLLNSNSDLGVKGDNGKTALDLASEQGHDSLFEMLIRGPTSNQDEDEDKSERSELSQESSLAFKQILHSESKSDEDISQYVKESPGKLSRKDTLDTNKTGFGRQDTLRKRTIKAFTTTGLKELNLTGGGADDQGEQRQPMSNLSAQPSEPNKWYHLNAQSKWEYFSQLTTLCCLPQMLGYFGGMKDRSIQQAWREKVALCLIILAISSGMGFLTFGFSSLVCKKVIPIFPDVVARDFGQRSNSTKLMIVRGQLYDVGSYFPVGNHRPILPFKDEDLQSTVDFYYGHDISKLFPPDRKSSVCKFWPVNNEDQCQQLGGDPRLHCHTSAESWDQLRKLSINNYVSFSWDNVTQSSGYDELFVFNEKVYSLREYFKEDNDDHFFGDDLNDILKGFVGRDVTKDILKHPRLSNLIPCFDEQMLVGQLDGTTIGCFASNLIMLIASAVLLTITAIKFLAAMAFDWFLSWKLGKISNKHRPQSSYPYLLMLVTCYSEGELSLRTTIDSLALSDYVDDHKLLFVIADGDITGEGNAKSTPELLLDMIEPLTSSKVRDPKPRTYKAIGDGAKALNMAQVHVGHYVVEERRIPMVLILKCGPPNERTMPKAGNRGKRDSQLILMSFLTNMCFNNKMSPLEYDLFEKMYVLTGVSPENFEMVLMVDADTKVMPDSIARMVSAMERDHSVMGLCGETKIDNKRDSWVTMIQVYEYYISHHLGKAFESIFGGVTCLPGCFCMYRVKVSKPNGYCVPILANPDILEAYSSNDTSTLHKKNLLLLGEDRYLTTLMLRAFPKRKMIYVPKAICKTMVPDEFSVLLSQRRRWINSTVHNLLELVLVPQLCGIFCCSMQFVILLELISTVVMPSSLMFLFYLVVGAFLGQDVLLPLLFMAALFLLQAFLILATTRKVSYIFWMLIYILALPVWNFVLPVYSFWHFDDFSWGATRKINGPDTGHASHGGAAPKDGPKLKLLRFQEWRALSRQRLDLKVAQKKERSLKMETSQRQKSQRVLSQKRDMTLDNYKAKLQTMIKVQASGIELVKQNSDRNDNEMTREDSKNNNVNYTPAGYEGMEIPDISMNSTPRRPMSSHSRARARPNSSYTPNPPYSLSHQPPQPTYSPATSRLAQTLTTRAMLTQPLLPRPTPPSGNLHLAQTSKIRPRQARPLNHGIYVQSPQPILSTSPTFANADLEQPHNILDAKPVIKARQLSTQPLYQANQESPAKLNFNSDFNKPYIQSPPTQVLEISIPEREPIEYQPPPTIGSVPRSKAKQIYEDMPLQYGEDSPVKLNFNKNNNKPYIQSPPVEPLQLSITEQVQTRYETPPTLASIQRDKVRVLLNDMASQFGEDSPVKLNFNKNNNKPYIQSPPIEHLHLTIPKQEQTHPETNPTLTSIQRIKARQVLNDMPLAYGEDSPVKLNFNKNNNKPYIQSPPIEPLEVHVFKPYSPTPPPAKINIPEPLLLSKEDSPPKLNFNKNNNKPYIQSPPPEPAEDINEANKFRTGPRGPRQDLGQNTFPRSMNQPDQAQQSLRSEGFDDESSGYSMSRPNSAGLPPKIKGPRTNPNLN